MYIVEEAFSLLEANCSTGSEMQAGIALTY